MPTTTPEEHHSKMVAAPDPAPDMVDVFRATGMRKPQGSATEFNRQIAADLGEIPLVAEATSAVRSGGVTIPLAIRDRGWLGRNTSALAGMFLAPESVNQIQELVRRGAATPFVDAPRRQALQSATQLEAR